MEGRLLVVNLLNVGQCVGRLLNKCMAGILVTDMHQRLILSIFIMVSLSQTLTQCVDITSTPRIFSITLLST